MSIAETPDMYHRNADESRYMKWRERATVSRLRFALHASLFIVVGLLFIIVGAFIGQVLEKMNYPFWWKFGLSIPLPLLGATILAQIMPLMVSRVGKYKVEFERIAADAEYLAGEVALLARWCRWRGPINNVHKERTDDIMRNFCEGAREIDILTPNLKDVAENVLESISRCRPARVRMMSLHPECSAMYRRWNDMGKEERQDFPTPRHYSENIRQGLDAIQNKRQEFFDNRSAKKKSGSIGYQELEICGTSAMENGRSGLILPFQ